MTGNKWALAVAVGAFTTTLVGGAALATFQPPLSLNEVSSVIPDSSNPVVDRDSPKGKLKATLDALVAKGTITQAQEDAILKAVEDAATASKPKPPLKPNVPNIRSFIGDLRHATNTYLGLSEKELALQLRSGKSIADVANGLSGQGKSATGLTAHLSKTANDKVDQAVASNKLTADQAAALKARITAEISSFVQRSFTKPVPRPQTPVSPIPPPKP